MGYMVVTDETFRPDEGQNVERRKADEPAAQVIQYRIGKVLDFHTHSILIASLFHDDSIALQDTMS